MPEPDHDPVIAGSGSGEIRSLNSLRGIAAMIVVVSLFGVPKESPVLANKLGDFVGRISYSLYLLHVPVMWAVRKLSLPNPIRFVIFLAVATLVATVSYHLLERPAARAVRRLGEQRSELESLRLSSR